MLSGVSSVAEAEETYAPSPTLRQALDARAGAARRVAPSLGVHVIDLETGTEVYGYRADQERILASNTKLFTSAAALDLLGPGYFFETELRGRGRLVDGTWQGQLAVLGGGDPNISGRFHYGDPYAVFRQWAAALRRQGIQRIDGDIYLAPDLFGDRFVHPDWPDDQLDRWYEAPVAALSFNDNCVLVKVWPTRPGQPARVQLVPSVEIFEVDNRARTANVRHSRVWITRSPGSAVIRVGGTISSRRSGPVEKWLTVPDPVRYFGAGLRDALSDEGLEIRGDVRVVETLPPGVWMTLAVHRSDLLSTLEVINKRSQNFYAESVFKLLGARQCLDGSWAGGSRVVSEFLQRALFEPGGLEEEVFQLADGSGMSRGNRATPRALTRLLRYMDRHPWADEFKATLPYSGEDDLSWEDRLAAPPYAGRVFAKTGTLNGVSTLSGYALGLSGRRYAFSILCNGAATAWQARRAQDAIIRALIDHG